MAQAQDSGKSGGGSRKKGLLILGGVVLVVIIAAVAAGLYVLGRFAAPKEATARFLPDDTQAYFTISLRPGAGQLLRARRLWATFEDTPGFIDRRDELLDDLRDATGIHFTDDVLPWLGRDITVALLDLDLRTEPEWVVLLQTKDRDASLEFLEELVDFLEEEMGEEFQDDSYLGASLFEEENDEASFAVTDRYVVMGGSRDTVEQLIEDMESPPERSLARDDAFVRARKQLPSDRFMLFFARSGDLYDGLTGFLGGGAFTGQSRNIPEAVALSSSFVDQGVRMDFYSDNPTGLGVVETRNRLATARALPQDTLFFLSFSGLQEAWGQVQETLEDMDEDTAQLLADSLDAFREATGTDLERDVIDQLDGELAVAVLPSDFRFEDSSPGTVNALLLAEVKETRPLQRTLDRLMGVLEDGLGVRTRTEILGSHEAVTLDLQGRRVPEEFRGYSPGYLFTEDLAALGSTLDALEQMADTLDGKNSDLASSPEFSRLLEMAPKDAVSVLFVNLAGVIEAVVDALPPAMRSTYARDWRPLVEPFHSFFAAGAASKEAFRATWVITVRRVD